MTTTHLPCSEVNKSLSETGFPCKILMPLAAPFLTEQISTVEKCVGCSHSCVDALLIAKLNEPCSVSGRLKALLWKLILTKREPAAVRLAH